MAKGKDKTTKVIDKSGPTGFVLFVAWIGALVYFGQQATGFGELIVAFLKACVWPAYLLYYGFQALGI